MGVESDGARQMNASAGLSAKKDWARQMNASTGLSAEKTGQGK